MVRKMVSMVRGCLVIGFCFLLVFPTFAADITLDEVVNKIQSNQSKIKDMYAETVTTITSNMAIPGQESKGPQKMVQKGKMWTKGENKSKIEMISPMRQTTITNGDKMMIVNPETGQKIIQDLKKLRQQSGMPDTTKQMSLEKAKEFFNLSVTRHQVPDTGEMQYIIVGKPKEENKFMSKMEFYVDSEKWVPVKVVMYDAKGKPMSQSTIEYTRIATDKDTEDHGVWVPVKNISNVTTPMGSMKVEMEFTNIKVNQGIKDEVFSIH